jgi:UBA/TS-N domain
VRRLGELGFDQSDAVQAYLACDKDEAMAANLLMDNMADIRADMGFAGQQQVQQQPAVLPPAAPAAAATPAATPAAAASTAAAPAAAATDSSAPASTGGSGESPAGGDAPASGDSKDADGDEDMYS